ncbi:hypothetical protein C8J57DRAFT_1726314 [Mycena rebaudengoi]|nr:hypothetical protein C8J57DRAFT_1726314 [Mycena rebaudengoi]
MLLFMQAEFPAEAVSQFLGDEPLPHRIILLLHTDDALLAGLANGHNSTVAHIEDMQSAIASFESRLTNLEANATTNTVTLGEVSRALQAIFAQLTQPKAVAPATSSPPVPPLAAVSVTPIAAPIPAPTSTAPLPPAVPSLADFTAAMQSTLAAALKRPHDDDADSRNVRARTDIGPPPIGAAPVGTAIAIAPTGTGTAPVSTAGLVHAPSKDPPRRINDLTKEVIFGPAIWPSNIHAAARTIITEGLESAKPLLRQFYTRRGTDTSNIIVGFESAEAAAWFVAAWTANRSAWHTIAASPNA